MNQINWAKFVSTEVIAFIAIFVVSTVALVKEMTTFEVWGAFVLGAAMTLGIVRRVKESQRIKANGGKP